MKKFCSNLKTSDKITFLFTVFNLASLIILLLGINVIYFFIWYSDQKAESWYDMNINYQSIVGGAGNNTEAFQKYILKKDTIVIPEGGGEVICSEGVAKKLHNNQELVDEVIDSLVYKRDGKIYLIFTKKYKEIGEVKVLFDTTPYIKSQIIIIKISLLIIFFSLFLYIIIGRRITKYSLRNLKDISEKAKRLDIEKDFQEIKIIGREDDEINILASTINTSFSHIKEQTSNLRQFITDVSHEFKTPLMIINSKIDVYNKKLEKKVLQKKDTQNLLENIKRSTGKLNKLLETFLILSRIENKIESLNREEKDIKKYLKEITQRYIKHNFQDIENISITYNFGKTQKFLIEENTFNILFRNLFSNAIKFSNPENIEIEIGANRKSFWVKDNGIGISKKDLENIGKKFFRKDKNIEGFGVGLFLVKRLLKLYSWKLDIETKEDNGTKFIIHI